MIGCSKCDDLGYTLHDVLGCNFKMKCKCVIEKERIEDLCRRWERFFSLTDPKEIYDAEEAINNACKKQAPDVEHWKLNKRYK